MEKIILAIMILFNFTMMGAIKEDLPIIANTWCFVPFVDDFGDNTGEFMLLQQEATASDGLQKIVTILKDKKDLYDYSLNIVLFPENEEELFKKFTYVKIKIGDTVIDTEDIRVVLRGDYGIDSSNVAELDINKEYKKLIMDSLLSGKVLKIYVKNMLEQSILITIYPDNIKPKMEEWMKNL